jgi:hypothetical protein
MKSTKFLLIASFSAIATIIIMYFGVVFLINTNINTPANTAKTFLDKLKSSDYNAAKSLGTVAIKTFVERSATEKIDETGGNQNVIALINIRSLGIENYEIKENNFVHSCKNRSFEGNDYSAYDIQELKVELKFKNNTSEIYYLLINSDGNSNISLWARNNQIDSITTKSIIGNNAIEFCPMS